MLGKVVMRVDDQDLDAFEKEKAIVKMLLSYFGDGLGLVGLLEYLDEENGDWRDLVVATAQDFTAENPRKPFSLWHDVDEDFRDLIGKMTSLDPRRRIKARDALEHPWFKI